MKQGRYLETFFSISIRGRSYIPKSKYQYKVTKQMLNELNIQHPSSKESLWISRTGGITGRTKAVVSYSRSLLCLSHRLKRGSLNMLSVRGRRQGRCLPMIFCSHYWLGLFLNLSCKFGTDEEHYSFIHNPTIASQTGWKYSYKNKQSLIADCQLI